MNRITQLAVESDLVEWDILPSGARTPNHESVVRAKKFAELIVKECASVVFKKTGPKSALDVLEHFGVEE